jgi:hypothetical protein
MGTKLTRITMTALIFLWLTPVCGALEALTEGDAKMLGVRHDFPANSFVVMEARLIEGGSTKPKICRRMAMTLSSDQGRKISFLTQDLFLFDRANNTFGGAAVLAPGTYTVVQIACDSHRYRGNFARFTVQSPQSINLGCLIVEFKGTWSNPFSYPTYSGHSRVVDLSPKAIESLTKRVPVSFGGTVKRYMTPILTDSNAKRGASQ